MTLWFEASDGKQFVVTEVNNWQDVWKAIDNFIEDCNSRRPKGTQPFKSYYTRVWKDPESGRTKIDFGSHTQFFYTDLEYDCVKDDS